MDGAIRQATDADAEAIAELVQLAYRGRGGWTTEADLLQDTRIGAEEVRSALRDPARAMLVIDGADGLLATCEVADRGAGVASFGLLAVRPGAQGGGVGGRLVAAAERLARDDLRAATLELVALAPRAELIAWYERLGFVRTGERRPFPPPGVRPDVPPLARDLEFVVLAKPLGG